jgi:hypothetical protein
MIPRPGFGCCTRVQCLDTTRQLSSTSFKVQQSYTMAKRLGGMLFIYSCRAPLQLRMAAASELETTFSDAER